MQYPKPTYVSIREGDDWIPFASIDAARKAVHAVKFEDGSVLDAVNGWRIPLGRPLTVTWSEPGDPPGTLRRSYDMREPKAALLNRIADAEALSSHPGGFIQGLRDGTPRDQPTDDAFGLGYKLDGA